MFNDKVGKYLRDDVSIGTLFLPSKHIDARVERIDAAFRRKFNMVLTSLGRARYRTIGSIRDVDPYVLARGRNICPKRVDFVQTAFARPQDEKIIKPT